MLFFRFDCEKEDFKGSEHKSKLYGHSCEDFVDEAFDNENIDKYYLDILHDLNNKYFDTEEISLEEYDEKVLALKKEYINDELTLDGCSCFELSEDDIKFSNNYKYYDRKIITIFEGEKIGLGHDGECVAKCSKIVWQGDSNVITDILLDDDTQDKVEAVLSKIM